MRHNDEDDHDNDRFINTDANNCPLQWSAVRPRLNDATFLPAQVSAEKNRSAFTLHKYTHTHERPSAHTSRDPIQRLWSCAVCPFACVHVCVCVSGVRTASDRTEENKNQRTNTKYKTMKRRENFTIRCRMHVKPITTHFMELTFDGALLCAPCP